MKFPVVSQLLKFASVLILAIQIFSLSLNANADETRPDHFEGLPADTLDEALINFKTYNKKLEAILAQEELSPEDMGEIHIITYTMENALQKMMAETGEIAEALESVHLGSETNDKEQVKLLGDYYLKQSAKLFGG